MDYIIYAQDFIAIGFHGDDEEVRRREDEIWNGRDDKASRRSCHWPVVSGADFRDNRVCLWLSPHAASLPPASRTMGDSYFGFVRSPEMTECQSGDMGLLWGYDIKKGNPEEDSGAVLAWIGIVDRDNENRYPAGSRIRYQ